MNIRNAPVIFNLLILFASITLYACQTVRQENRPLLRIDSQNHVNDGFKLESRPLNAVPMRVQVSSELLNFRTVKNASAPIRSGPGTIFPIHDDLLKYDDKVIVFNSSGNWRKIFIPRINRGGWVHRGHLRKYTPSEKKDLEIETKNMPVVSAARNINRVFSYGDEEKIEVKIPYSSQFLFLKQSSRRVLVWFSKVNIVAWVEKSSLI